MAIVSSRPARGDPVGTAEGPAAWTRASTRSCCSARRRPSAFTAAGVAHVGQIDEHRARPGGFDGDASLPGSVAVAPDDVDGRPQPGQWTAAARPIPDVAPVTTTVRPAMEAGSSQAPKFPAQGETDPAEPGRHGGVGGDVDEIRHGPPAPRGACSCCQLGPEPGCGPVADAAGTAG